jgi:RND family efflux transporter MFP subunit
MKPKMKPLIIVLSVLAFCVGSVLMLSGCKDRADSTQTENGAKQETLYTCGMHPQIIQKKPGNCPICEMKLTPIRKQPSEEQSTGSSNSEPRKIKFYKSTMNPGEISPIPGVDSMGMDMVPVYEDAAEAIAIDSVTLQKMGVRIGIVTNGPVKRVVRTVGSIDFDETTLVDITTKYRGWIEKLFVNATGQQVHRGDPLFDIYSPELYSAQTEYLVALNATNYGGDSLKTAARNKLKFLDVSDAQILELETTREATRTLRVTAPRDGVVDEKMAVEGQMVEAGMRLYRLADLTKVWVLSQVYEQDIPYISLSQEAALSLVFLPGRQLSGRVAYIYPTVDDKTRTVRVRIELDNPDHLLKPGMYATVEMESTLVQSAVLVPDSAVLRSGQKNTVFVALDKGRFEPRTVTLGSRSTGNFYQAISGLQAGEKVVVSGQFMLDSESQLREAIQKMSKPSEVAP